MAGYGPPPAATKRRRNTDPLGAPTTITVEPCRTDGMPGFDLPPRPEDDDWHPMTRMLWSALRRSPLMWNEPELGWLYLLDTMLMHHTMWAKGRWEFAAELRLRLAQFGTTPADRLRLRIKIETPIDDPTETSSTGTTPAAASRRRSLRIVDA